MNDLLNLTLEGDAFLNGMTDIFTEPAVLILVPLGVVSTQWVRLLEYSCLPYGHENVLS